MKLKIKWNDLEMFLRVIVTWYTVAFNGKNKGNYYLSH